MQALFDFLASIWRELWPWEIIAPDEEGIRITTLPKPLVWLVALFGIRVPPNGQWITDLKPGAAWKLPLLSEIRVCKVTPSYVDLNNITVETADKKCKLISVTAKFRVGNARQALLLVDDYESSVAVDIQAAVTAWANKLTAAEITVERLINDCTPVCREATRRWGCYLRELGVNSIADHRIYRILAQ